MKTTQQGQSCGLPRIAMLGLLMGAPAAFAAETDSTASQLPVIEVKSERSYFDPRPKKVSTATKTDSDPRDIPQTINSVSLEQVSSYGGRDLASALSGVPGVSNTSDTRFDSFRIRGFSNAGDVLLDGLRDDAQYVRSLGNIERVEILKGPAAVLYGRGGGGGVINQITKQPGHDVQSSIAVTAGSQGRLGFAADINHVVSDEVTMRINAGRETANSFRNGVESTRQYVAPSVKWANSRTSLVLQAEYAEFDRVPDRGMPAQVAPVPTGTPTSYSMPVADPSTFYGVIGRDYIKDTNLNLRSTLTHRLNEDWELRHVFSVLDLNSNFDNTYVTGNYITTPRNYNGVPRSRYQQDMKQRNVQTNLELNGKLMTGAIRHNLLVGMEYGQQKRNPLLWSISTTPAAIINPNNARDSGNVLTQTASMHRINSYSAYAQDQIDLTPQWKLLTGLRWDRFEVDSTNQLKNINSKRTSSALSPRFGVVWSPVAEHSLYASYSKNFAPVGGDLIGISPDASGNTYDLGPQFSRQYEAGVKSDWFNGKLSSTLSVFQLDLYNRTMADAIIPNLYYQTGLERNRGIELNLNGELARNWFLRSGFSVQNARIIESETKYVNKRSTGVSGKNGSVFISYAPPMGFFAETGLVYEGSRFVDRDNLLEMSGYVRWDGKMGYRFQKTDVSLAVTNLNDRRYYATSTSLSQIVPASPRAFVMNVSYKF